MASEGKELQRMSFSTRSQFEKTLDRGFLILTRSSAIAIAVLLIAIAATLAYRAFPAMQTYGLGFLVGQEWNPVAGRERYGVLPMLYGTLASSAIALVIAVPLGIGTAIFLSEDFLPRPLKLTLVFLVELLAAIPSVVYGLWGIFFVIPLLQPTSSWLHQHLSWLPLFSTAPVGPGLLPAGIVLAIMILPIITALSRSSLNALPADLRQAAFALGATRWETILRCLLPAAASGIVGAVVLALGRAMGETMAVTMLIGNSNQLSTSLLAPANTIASLLANQFAEAKNLQVAALMYAGLMLLLSTLLVNSGAEVIVRRVRRGSGG